MPKGRVTSVRVTLTDADRRTLEAWQRSTTMPIGRANRGRIILLMAQGWTISQIARAIPITRRFVYKWVARFLVHGLDGLHDLPRPGAGSHRTGETSPPPQLMPKHHGGEFTLTLPSDKLGRGEDTMPEPMSPGGYAYAAGARCPACQGTDLARGRYESAHADTVTRRWACENCGATWAAVYELTGYEGLRKPGKESDADPAGERPD